MRKMASIATGLGLVGMLAGCGSTGINRARPDEFAVARQAPLVIPPDFSLVPPAPGTAPTSTANPNAQALDALFGGSAARSASETATLDAAGGDSSAAGIRSDVGDPGTAVVDKAGTTRDIVAAPEGDGQDARATTPTPKP
ncbi:MAG: DUF3035 domain-containing protein [Pseudomonadota bacterium]|nr:DUF3035 domain-containing protein [Sphingomonas sp. ERG5]